MSFEGARFLRRNDFKGIKLFVGKTVFEPVRAHLWGRPFFRYRYHCIVESIVAQVFVTFDPGIAERGVFIPSKRKHCLIHLLSVEYPEPNEQVEIFHSQSGYSQKQVWLQFGDDVLK